MKRKLEKSYLAVYLCAHGNGNRINFHLLLRRARQMQQKILRLQMMNYRINNGHVMKLHMKEHEHLLGLGL